jgi:hypothetical protein
LSWTVISVGDAGWTVRGNSGGSRGTFIWTKTFAAASAGIATAVATRSAVYRCSVMNRTSGRDTSSRRSWLEETYAKIAIETMPM